MTTFLAAVEAGGRESFPFLAAVSTDDVNVRAGGNINFEQICQLNKGEEVVVLGRSYEWYQIRLPSQALSFINGKYVRLLSGQEGEITAKGVNVRAADVTNATVLGQLEEGSRVRILEKKGEWYRISPPSNACGWVSDRFLVFKSADITAYRLPELPAITSPKAPKAVEAPPPFLSGSRRNEGERLTVMGVVEAVANPAVVPTQYQLLIDGRPAYYLKGLKSILDEFVNQKVTIEGSVDRQAQGRYAYPVLIVSKVQLVL